MYKQWTKWFNERFRNFFGRTYWLLEKLISANTFILTHKINNSNKKSQNTCLIQKLFIPLPRYYGLLQTDVNYCKYTIFIQLIKFFINLKKQIL